MDQSWQAQLFAKEASTCFWASPCSRSVRLTFFERNQIIYVSIKTFISGIDDINVVVNSFTNV